jgi:hypothetical protein
MVELAMEIRSELSVPHTVGDDATSTAPRIVNGLTVRPREKVNVWRIVGFFFGSVFIPEAMALIAIAVFGVRRILGRRESRGGDAT